MQPSPAWKQNPPAKLTPSTLLVVCALIGVLTVAVSLIYSPAAIYQGADSGTFSYVGKVISEGGDPYFDAWENKPPLIYYTNALAILLFGESLWSLWAVETLAVAGMTIMLAWLAYQHTGQARIAWVNVIVFLLIVRNPFFTEDVNETEAYALLFQIGCFLSGYLLVRQPRLVPAILVGLTSCAAFLYKPSTIGVALAFVPAAALTHQPFIESPRQWRWSGVIVASGLAGLGAVAAAMVSQGLLAEMYQASFIFPREYLTWTSGGQIGILRGAWLALTSLMTLLLVLATGVCLLPGMVVSVREVFKRESQRSNADRFLAVWALLTLVADYLLINISGESYDHYFLTPLAAVMILCAGGLQFWSARFGRQNGNPGVVWFAVISLSLALPAALFALSANQFAQVQNRPATLVGPARTYPGVTYILDNTQDGDSIYVWGLGGQFYFQTGRRSPTRYFFSYPLLPPAYREERVAELVQDLQTAEVPLIIDASLAEPHLWTPPIGADMRAEWLGRGGRGEVDGFEAFFEFVLAHCEVDEMPVQDLRAYQCSYD